MGRRRLHDDPYQPLPKGLYLHGRRFRTRDGKGGWVAFDGPYEAACRAYRAWRQEGPPSYYGSVAWLLDWYVTDIAPRLVARRTLTDYLRDAETLKAGIGHIPADLLNPPHIARYKAIRAETAPVHVNRELSVLRSAFRAGVEAGQVRTNPVPAVRRMSETPRDRLISDAEYLLVYQRAPSSVKVAMILALRTLQRPADVLHFGPRNVHGLDDGRRVLRFKQGKTGQLLEILIEGEIARVIDTHPSNIATYVHNREGRPYTVMGLGAMFRRCCGPGKDESDPRLAVVDFGLRDLRAKGATDLYRAGADVRHIQALLGHKTETMTRTYLKKYVPGIVRPNDRPVIAEAK